MRATAILSLLLGMAPAATAATVSYYVGIDNLNTLTTGPYAGLANPNFGRLTLLLNHGDHFHGIGAYSYSGYANRRIPELSSGEAPLPLSTGAGVYAGKLTNAPGPSEYSAIDLNSMNQLEGFAPGTDEDVLFRSSNQRWNSSLAGAQLALELLFITPGLTVGSASNPDVFEASNLHFLGDGAGFAFSPVFWTEGSAPPGTYSVTMRLQDLRTNSPAGQSGEFTFDFAVPAAVPEPGAGVLLASGLLATFLAARRKR